MNPQPLGTLLRSARVERGLSLNELARQCGTNPGNIKRLEDDAGPKVAWESVCRVCEALGLDVADVRAKTRA